MILVSPREVGVVVIQSFSDSDFLEGGGGVLKLKPVTSSSISVFE